MPTCHPYLHNMADKPVAMEARKALDRLRPLMQSEDTSLAFLRVSSCTAEETWQSLWACMA